MRDRDRRLCAAPRVAGKDELEALPASLYPAPEDGADPSPPGAGEHPGALGARAALAVPLRVDIVAPAGRLSASVVTLLEDELDDLLAHGTDVLLLDFANVTALDASAFEALLRVRERARARGGELALAWVRPATNKAVESAGLSHRLLVFSSLRDASAWLVEVGAARCVGEL